MQWLTLNIGGKISMFASVLFQFLLLALFLTLYIQTRKQPQQPQQVIENPEIDTFLKELLKELNAKDSKEKLKGGLIKNGQKDNIKN